jgi:hypothetical protein
MSSRSVISPSMFIIAVALAAPACKKSEPAKQQPATETAAAKALPGTESVQKLLSGVGKSAAPSAGTTLALGGILGKGGMLGGTPAQGMGVVGATPTNAPAGGAKPIAIDDDATDDPVAAAPVDIKLPPAAAAGGDCTAVATRIGAIMIATAEAQLGNDAETRKIAEPMIRDAAKAVQTELDRECTAQSWPKDLKDCLLTASDATTLQGCEKFVTQAMKDAAAAAPAAHAPRPTTPAPKSTGRNDCGAVGAHTAAITEWELSVAPPDLRASAADLITQMKSAVEQQCTQGAWSESVRTCVVGAGSMTDLNACSAKL